jgi:hypothetical protein
MKKTLSETRLDRAIVVKAVELGVGKFDGSEFQFIQTKDKVSDQPMTQN